jgi:hypothetical protein
LNIDYPKVNGIGWPSDDALKLQMTSSDGRGGDACYEIRTDQGYVHTKLPKDELHIINFAAITKTPSNPTGTFEGGLAKISASRFIEFGDNVWSGHLTCFAADGITKTDCTIAAP